jgi:hypothetical protein
VASFTPPGEEPHVRIENVAGLAPEPVWAMWTVFLWSRVSAGGIATGYGLEDRGVGVQVPVGSRIFASPRVQTSSGAHPTSYPKGTWGFFPEGKAAGE